MIPSGEEQAKLSEVSLLVPMKIAITLALLAVSLSSAFAAKIEVELIGIPSRTEISKVPAISAKGVDSMALAAISLKDGHTRDVKLTGGNNGEIQLRFSRQGSKVYGTAYIATPTRKGGVHTLYKQFSVSITDSTVSLGSYPSVSTVPVKVLGLPLWNSTKTDLRDLYIRLSFS